MRVAMVGLLLFAALAGCTGTKQESAGASGPDIYTTFDAVPTGTVPTGWTRSAGTWAVIENSTARSGTNVLRGVGAADPGFSSILVGPGASYDNLDLAVDFRIVSGGQGASGDVPQGAGAVVHYADAKNFQIIRYSITENSWNLFTLKDGKRDKQASANPAGDTTHPAFGQWVHLAIASEDGTLTVKDGTTTVLQFTLPEGHSRTGSAGPFVRGDTTAFFDNFEIDP